MLVLSWLCKQPLCLCTLDPLSRTLYSAVIGLIVIFTVFWVDLFCPFSPAVFRKRQKTRMRCHDDWLFCWTMGCTQLQQQGEVYLQETSRGCTSDDSATHHPGPELWVRLDPCCQKELLLQSRRRNWANEWKSVWFFFKVHKLTYFPFPLVKKVYGKTRNLKKTWFEARDFCRAIGGDLISIHSSQDLSNAPYVSITVCSCQNWILLLNH